MAQIAIPSVGIAMEEALLVKWHKQPGDEVSAAEPVAEIETDKATMDLESPVPGRLGPHLFEPGAIVPVGTVIVEVVAEGEQAVAPPAAEAATSDPAPAESRTPPPSSASGAGSEIFEGRRPHAKSPRARRLAQDRPEAAPATERFRNLIAAKVSQSWQEIPHFAVAREVDAGQMLGALNELRATGIEPAPTFTDLLLRGLALALREAGGGPAGDVGLAVATEHGVVIPVVHGVLGLDPAGLAAARVAAVERARSGRLTPEDLGATPLSTLSNLGSMGVDHFTGVIALGQTSLLTTGRAVPRAAVGADGALTARTTFHATLNVDHRTIDGAGAARLLVAFTDAAEQMTADFLEEP